MKHTGTIGSVVFGLLLLSAFAHHSTTMFDRERLVRLEGTVAQYKFLNPHVVIDFDVVGEDGKIQNWHGECSGVAQMRRNGWNSTYLKPGDKIVAIGNPRKDGGYGMRLNSMIVPDGQELSTWRVE